MIVKPKHLDVDWEAYFKSIEDVCPWSLEAYNNDKIKFHRYSDTKMLYYEETWDDRYQAIVYYDVSSDVDDLIWTVDQMDGAENTICFWSHPDHTKGKNKQCPIPIIIQQGRHNLETIRREHKYNKRS